MKLPQFQASLKKQKIDLAFFFHPDLSITYFTQFRPSHALFMVQPENATLFLSKLDRPPRMRNITIKEMPKDWITSFRNSKFRNVGINKASITVAHYETLQKMYPLALFVDIGDIVESLRSVKTHDEIRTIRRACMIADNALKKLIKELPKHTLKTEQDVALFLERQIRQQGADVAFPTIIAMGKNAAIPHHKTGLTKLCRGFLLLDFGACYQNYCSDMTRMLFLGLPFRKEKEAYNLLLKAQKEAIRNVKKNLPFAELEKISRKILGREERAFTHSLGHGVGIEIHESPNYAVKSKDKISKGQIFTVEPGLYYPRKFGLRIEDTLLFNDKAEILTRSSKKLISIKGDYK